MSGNRSFRVELLEALLVSASGPRPPYLFALPRQRWTLPSEAGPLPRLAGFPVLLVGVRWTGPRHAGAGFFQVTLVR